MGFLIRDLIEEHSATEVVNATTARRMFLVELDPTQGGNTIGRAFDNIKFALEDDRIPKPGEAHPFLANVVVSSREIRAVDTKLFKVTCNYRTFSPSDALPGAGALGFMSAEISSGLQTVETNYGRPKQGGVGGGNQPMTVLDPVTNQRQAATASFQVPVVNMRFRFRRPFPPTISELNHVGAINSVQFNPGSLVSGGSFASRTVLCTSINASTDDGGTTWITSYEFMYQNPEIGDSNFASNASVYDVVLAPTDDTTGRPRAVDEAGDPITQADLAIYEIYPQRNHNVLIGT